MGYPGAQSSRHSVHMRDGDDGGVCNVMVVGWAEGNTVCATCGMTLVESPFEGNDYFDMIMRPGRPGHAVRRRPPR